MKNRLNGAMFPFIRSPRDENRSANKLTVFGNLGLRAGGLRCILEIRGSHLHPIDVNLAILWNQLVEATITLGNHTSSAGM